MTHEDTQKVASSPSCCERVKVNQKLSRPRSPVKQPDPSCLPPNTGEESRRSSESGSRASTRTSRPGKTSSGPVRTTAPTHRSRSPLSRAAKDRGTIANPYSEGEESDPRDQDYTVVGDGGERSEGSARRGQRQTPWSQEPSNTSVRRVTLPPEGLRKIKQLKRV